MKLIKVDPRFWRCEVEANIQMAWMMIGTSGVLVLAWILNAIGVFRSGDISGLAIVGTAASIIPALICLVFKGEKIWIICLEYKGPQEG